MKYLIVITGTFATAAMLFGQAQEAPPTTPPADKGAPGKATTAETSRPAKSVVSAISATATVEDVDKGKRTLDLKTADGRTETVKIGKEVRNFDQIKKGDQVKVTYYESAAIEVRSPSDPPTRRETTAVAGREQGEKPGGLAVDAVEITAAVEAVDYEKRTVTVKGPEGRVKTIKVGPEVKRLNEIKKGDQIAIRYTEALAIEVDKP